MNDGAGSDEFIEIDAETIRNQPTYTEHTTSHLMVEGATYVVFLQAYNINGVVTSESMAFVLASVPTTPTVAPASDLLISSSSQLKIDIQMVTDNGGSPIIVYSIELDDGQGGPFVVVNQDMKLTHLEASLTRGLQYRARYQAKNVIGWSEYSPIGYLLAVSVPSAPGQP